MGVRRRWGYAWWPFVFGWMTGIQALSTLVSVYPAVLLFGLFGIPYLSGLANTGYAEFLDATSFLANPVGVVVAFLLCPILLEVALWMVPRLVLEYQVASNRPGLRLTLPITTLFTGACAANGCSFLAAVLLFINPAANLWIGLWWAGGWVLSLPLIIAAVWSIVSTSRR